jgi:teichoic acid transport system permease protein
MRERGRLTAPGSLLNTAVLAPDSDTIVPPSGDLARMAAEYGLRPSSARPGLISYMRLVWQRRHFILAYATARNVSMYTEARLGQLWQVLTPLLNSAVYYLIFGIIFEQNRGIEHYIAYLVIGVFFFSFTERSIVVGSTVMRANIDLIRALYFPRACLPLAYVLVELQQLALSMVVVFPIVLVDGEPLTWYWLFLVPTLLLQGMFNVGAALIMARLGAGAQDFSQLIPFLTRVWRYFCGVMYSITSLPSYATLPGWAKDLISLNPAAVYISLARFALMETQRTNAPGAKPYSAALCEAFTKTKKPPLQAYCHPTTSIGELWLVGIGWAVVTLLVGVVYFWQAETRYGRGLSAVRYTVSGRRSRHEKNLLRLRPRACTGRSRRPRGWARGESRACTRGSVSHDARGRG